MSFNGDNAPNMIQSYRKEAAYTEHGKCSGLLRTSTVQVKL